MYAHCRYKIMKKTLAIIVLLLAALGAGGFAYLQWKANSGARAEIDQLTAKATDTATKQEEAEKELAEVKEKLAPLELTAQQMEALKAAFASGVTLKDLETAYAKVKNLSAERVLGLAGLRLITQGLKDPATLSAFEKALDMTDWAKQQKVICSAQYALAAAGKDIKPLSECAMPAKVAAGAESTASDQGSAGGKNATQAEQVKGGGHDDKKVAHWDYEGPMGPENWGKEFPRCGRGKEQAPLDIKGPFLKARFSIAPDYKPGPLRILNNGHTIQVNVNPGSKMRIDGVPYDLLQFHFHRPSEEALNGKRQAMVIHFVHKNAGGELAVLGVLLQMGNENPGIKTLWSHAPEKEGPEQQPDGVVFNPANLLPREMDFYHYDGSLTTPPCTEKVKFFILRTMVNIAPEQVNQFPFKLNARPIQPLNDRVIMAN
jgi:carbonic anhydrase